MFRFVPPMTNNIACLIFEKLFTDPTEPKTAHHSFVVASVFREAHKGFPSPRFDTIAS